MDLIMLCFRVVTIAAIQLVHRTNNMIVIVVFLAIHAHIASGCPDVSTLVGPNVRVRYEYNGDTAVFYCDKDYVLIGYAHTRRWECIISSWSPGPGRDPITCKHKSAIGNCTDVATLVGKNVNVRDHGGDSVILSCDRGYLLTGNGYTPIWKCENSKWSPGPNSYPNIKCEIISSIGNCPDAEELVGGNVKVWYSYRGDSVVFSCESGYQLTGHGNRDTWECVGSTWSPGPGMYKAWCQAVSCPDLPALEHGSYSPSSKTSYDTHVSYTCNDGYVPRNDVTYHMVHTIRCNEAGKWDPLPPTCSLPECPRLKKIPHLIIDDQGGNNPGGFVDYSCSKPHQLEGPAQASCNADGEWDPPQQPFCKPLCSSKDLTDPAHGEVSSVAGLQATYSCEDGYEIHGTAQATCTARSTDEGGDYWAPQPPPTCELAKCPRIPAMDPSTGKYTYDEEQRTYMTAVTYTCEEDYHPDTPVTITCQADRQWSITPPPVCRKLLCDDPKRDHLVILVQPDNNVKFRCDDGHTLEGGNSTICNVDNRQMNDVPHCIPNPSENPEHEIGRVVEVVVVVLCILCGGLTVAFAWYLIKPKSGKKKKCEEEDRAFSVCAPKLGNCLPADIRDCKSIDLFKQKLKTFQDLFTTKSHKKSAMLQQ